MNQEAQQRIMGYFIEEARDHLTTIEQGLLSLRESMTDPELINELFRAAHSIKGGSAMLGLSSIQRTAHRMEDFFNVFRSRQGQVPVDQHLETLLLRGYDTLAMLLEELQSPKGLTEEVTKSVMADIEPIFEETEQHIHQLLGEVAPATSKPTPVKPATPAVSTLQEAMTQTVPPLMRQMLELFKQREQGDVRPQLAQVGQSLYQIGVTHDQAGWKKLTQAVSDAIAKPQNDLRTLALIVLRDLKQGQQAILDHKSELVAPSGELLALAQTAPVAVVAAAPVMTEAQKRILGFFLEEAKEHLATIEQSLLTLKDNLDNREFIDELFRAAHSIKGGSAQLGLTSIQRVTHRMEDFFSIYRTHLGQVPVDQKLESLFLKTYDALSGLMEHLQANGSLPDAVGAETLAEIEPVFTEIEAQIALLRGETPVSVPAITLSPQQLAITEEIPALLRQMLEQFKQPPSTEVQARLVQLNQSLQTIGITHQLPQWQHLTAVVGSVLAIPNLDLNSSAVRILRDLRQAQQALQAGNLESIAPSADLLALVPVSLPEPLVAAEPELESVELESVEPELELAPSVDDWLSADPMDGLLDLPVEPEEAELFVVASSEADPVDLFASVDLTDNVLVGDFPDLGAPEDLLDLIDLGAESPADMALSDIPLSAPEDVGLDLAAMDFSGSGSDMADLFEPAGLGAFNETDWAVESPSLADTAEYATAEGFDFPDLNGQSDPTAAPVDEFDNWLDGVATTADVDPMSTIQPALMEDLPEIFTPTSLDLGAEDESAFTDLFANAEELAGIEDPNLNFSAASVYTDPDPRQTATVFSRDTESDLSDLFAEVANESLPESVADPAGEMDFLSLGNDDFSPAGSVDFLENFPTADLLSDLEVAPEDGLSDTPAWDFNDLVGDDLVGDAESLASDPLPDLGLDSNLGWEIESSDSLPEASDPLPEVEEALEDTFADDLFASGGTGVDLGWDLPDAVAVVASPPADTAEAISEFGDRNPFLTDDLTDDASEVSLDELFAIQDQDPQTAAEPTESAGSEWSEPSFDLTSFDFNADEFTVNEVADEGELALPPIELGLGSDEAAQPMLDFDLGALDLGSDLPSLEGDSVEPEFDLAGFTVDDLPSEDPELVANAPESDEWSLDLNLPSFDQQAQATSVLDSFDLDSLDLNSEFPAQPDLSPPALDFEIPDFEDLSDDLFRQAAPDFALDASDPPEPELESEPAPAFASMAEESWFSSSESAPLGLISETEVFFETAPTAESVVDQAAIPDSYEPELELAKVGDDFALDGFAAESDDLTGFDEMDPLPALTELELGSDLTLDPDFPELPLAEPDLDSSSESESFLADFGTDPVLDPLLANLDRPAVDLPSLDELGFASEDVPATDPEVPFDLDSLFLDEPSESDLPAPDLSDDFDLDSMFTDPPVGVVSGIVEPMIAEPLPLPDDFDRLDALFAEDPDSEALLLDSSSSQSSMDADGDGLIDLDELSSFFEEEVADASAPAPLPLPTPAVDPFEDELASLFGDEPATTSSNGGFVASAAPRDANLDDLDDLAALFDEPATPAPATSAPSFDDELDAILGDLDLGGSVAGLGGVVAATAAVTAAVSQIPSQAPVRVTIAPDAKPSTRKTAAFNNQTMRVEVRHLDSINNLVGELVVNRNSLEQNQGRIRQFLDGLLSRVQQLGELGQRMQDQYDRSLLETALISSRVDSGRSSMALNSGRSGSGYSASAPDNNQNFDALEMDRFTAFHALSQEIIELIVRVRESSSDIQFGVDEADQVVRQFRQVTTQLQEGLNRARMVAFSQIADRLPRAIRDLSIKTGKQASLIVEGRDTSIDKAILEELYDPMTHLVNNALVHGIEKPDERRRAGKSPEGKITIKAFYQGNQTIIVVNDDGGGIPMTKVRDKAIKLGLISDNADEDEVYNVLFNPGFSGRSEDEVDDLAGRGVGLDVVRRNITDLRGSIQIDSSPGKGTTFTIRLPLTLSISKAMLCVSNKALIAFPLDGVEEMLDVPTDEIETDDKGRPTIPWRDTRLHYQSLSNLLGYSRSHNRSRSEVYAISQDEGIVPVVILQSAGQYVALQVDSFVEEQEIVIKQLRGPAPKPPGIAGATVLGNGRVLPIADIIELVDMAQGRTRRVVSDLWGRGDEGPEAEPERQTTVLIIDDSITVRELLSMTFNKAGYRVEQARDGQDAWEKLRGGLPCDLIFCDIEMPRMDGLELLARIREDIHLQHLPMAMLTSRGAERHRQEARNRGATAYFTKPYLEEELMTAAARMLKGEVLLVSKPTEVESLG